MEKQIHQSAAKIQEAEKMACGQCPGQEGGRKRVCSSTEWPRGGGGGVTQGHPTADSIQASFSNWKNAHLTGQISFHPPSSLLKGD